jgi:hypothetical protein
MNFNEILTLFIILCFFSLVAIIYILNSEFVINLDEECNEKTDE